MAEKETAGITLPEKHFKFINKTIKDTYGMGIQEIAANEPTFAFQALKTGMVALFTRRGMRQLVQETSTEDGEAVVTATSERRMDGEAAFVGTVTHATNGVVDLLVSRYEHSESDFVISVTRNNGLVRRLMHLEPVTEVAAVIPYVAPTEPPGPSV